MSYVIYNDVHLIPFYIFNVVTYMALLLVSIISHEFGHIIYFKRVLKKKVKFSFNIESIWNFWFETGVPKDYKDLSDDEYLGLNWAGVMAGTIPIIIWGFIFFPVLLMIIPYGAGCWNDLKEITKIHEKRGENLWGLEDDEE